MNPTLQAARSELNIAVDLIPIGNSNRPGIPLVPRKITIHNTDNSDPGADARVHAIYQKGADARRRSVSWHFTVDDHSIYQSLPVSEIGWHTGTHEGNYSSIGIEICENQGIDQEAANDRAARLTAVQLHELGISLQGNVVQHYDWSGKDCPYLLRHPESEWEKFLAAVTHYYQGIDLAEYENRHVPAAGLVSLVDIFSITSMSYHGELCPVTRDRTTPAAPAAVSRPFSRPAGDAHDDSGNWAHTDGLQGTETTYDDGSVIIDANEQIRAHYDGGDYGPALALQTRSKQGNKTLVHQEAYCWQRRALPDVTLEENHPGFGGTDYFTGYATRFGKNDGTDSGAGSPTYKIVQTCSEVFGVAIKAEMMGKILGSGWQRDPRRLTAVVEVYRPDLRKFARTPIVEEGPGNPAALIDLTWALDQFLGTDGGAEVQFRIVV